MNPNNNICEYYGPPLDDLRVEMYRDVPRGLFLPAEGMELHPMNLKRLTEKRKG